MKSTLVVTTIASPNDCLDNLSHGASSNNYNFICIGDKKSPEDFKLNKCEFYGVKEQEQLSYALAKKLPWNHYSRKNLGYLIAIEKGCEHLLETDDDNFPEDVSFWKIDPLINTKNQIVGNGWVNIYSHFGVDAWPRGFPLEKIREPDGFEQLELVNKAYILQSLVNGDPDVDAVFRLTRGLDITFGQYDPIALGENVWCPFNSQNTLWLQQAFPLLYLPVTCSFRATDIVRSYVAQRCLWAMQGHVVFSGANAKQIRNEHNLLKDFDDEIVIYLKAEKIRQALSDLELAVGLYPETILNNLMKCYRKLIDLEVVLDEELSMVEAWAEDILKAITAY